jgi:hypothetical protein
MIHIWNAIKSIFVNDAHGIISKRGKEVSEESQRYTFISIHKPSRTESIESDIKIDRNGKRRKNL